MTSDSPATSSWAGYCRNTPIAQWPPNLPVSLVHLLEEASALDDGRLTLFSIGSEIQKVLLELRKTMPPAAFAEATKPNGDSPLRMAFLLGQLHFAQLYANTVANMRPDEKFFEAFKSETLKPVIAALSTRPSTLSELSSALGVASAEITLRLRNLVGTGIADYREKPGGPAQTTATEFFLTPAGKAYANIREG